MGLPTLYNLPSTPETLDAFSFANMDEHRKIAAALLAQLTVDIALYPLDPMGLGQDLGNWLYNHQIVHNAQNAALGIAGNDLTTVDFTDISQLTNWIELHAGEHYQASQLLGLN